MLFQAHRLGLIDLSPKLWMVPTRWHLLSHAVSGFTVTFKCDGDEVMQISGAWLYRFNEMLH